MPGLAAQLVLAADHSVSLRDVAQLLSEQPDVAFCGMSEGKDATARFLCPGRHVCVSVALRRKGACTLLQVEVKKKKICRAPGRHETEPLIHLVNALVRDLPVDHVAWPGTAQLIPRASFLQNRGSALNMSACAARHVSIRKSNRAGHAPALHQRPSPIRCLPNGANARSGTKQDHGRGPIPLLSNARYERPSK